MREQSYSREFTASVRPEVAFRAITKEIDKWWFTNVGEIYEENQIITFVHWTMRIAELMENRKIAMECIKANHIVQGVSKKLQEQIKEEWLGITIVWSLENQGDGVKVVVQHDGLVPKLFCYEMCSKGWDHFWSSLEAYLKTGTGTPAEIPE